MSNSYVEVARAHKNIESVKAALKGARSRIDMAEFMKKLFVWVQVWALKSLYLI